MRAAALAPALLVIGACARHADEQAPPATTAATTPATATATAAPAIAGSAPAGASPLLRGVIVMSTENARVTPCGETASVDLLDHTAGTLGRVYSDLASQDTGEMYAELRGERRPDAFVAAALVRALPMGGTPCEGALAPGEWRATGTEPFWSARVGAAGITWEAPDLPAPLTFPAAAPAEAEGARTWTVSSGGHRLVLTLRPAECRDGMSSAWYELTAKANLDGRDVTGCASGGS